MFPCSQNQVRFNVGRILEDLNRSQFSIIRRFTTDHREKLVWVFGSTPPSWGKFSWLIFFTRLLLEKLGFQLAFFTGE